MKPSTASVSPSRTVASTAAARDKNSSIRYILQRTHAAVKGANLSKAAELEKDHTTGGTTEGVCARLGMALADWSKRWFPDAFVFAQLAILFVFAAGIVGNGVRDLVKHFGDGFWILIPFTMR